MTVWLLLPSANVANCRAVFPKWREMGYRIAVLLNGPGLEWANGAEYPFRAELIWKSREYPGWGNSINFLACMPEIQDADWIVGAGDDMLPDPNIPADQIAAQCTAHFGGTFGVMQPTGDRWMVDKSGRPVSERICGSPWLGREFRERANKGKGAFHPDFVHYYSDQLLKEHAEKLGILWQRPDLTHLHKHWSRDGYRIPRPDYMEKIHDAAWKNDKQVYIRLKHGGFRECEPLEKVNA